MDQIAQRWPNLAVGGPKSPKMVQKNGAGTIQFPGAHILRRRFQTPRGAHLLGGVCNQDGAHLGGLRAGPAMVSPVACCLLPVEALACPRHPVRGAGLDVLVPAHRPAAQAPAERREGRGAGVLRALPAEPGRGRALEAVLAGGHRCGAG